MHAEGLTRSVEVGAGRRMCVHEFGAPEGVPVVYCHGGLSSSRDVAFCHDAATRRGVRLLAVCRPGIGDSFRSMPRTVADFADDVARVCDELSVGSFAALGWSAGGPFALGCAARLEDRVTRVATLGGMAPLRDPIAVRDLGLLADRLLFPTSRRAPAIARVALEVSGLGSDESLKTRLVRSLSSPSDRGVVDAQTAEDTSSAWRHAVAHGTRGLVDDYAVAGSPWGFSLHQVRQPATVFQGEQDSLVPRFHAEALAARLSQGRLCVVEHAGHFVLHVATDQVLDALVA